MPHKEHRLEVLWACDDSELSEVDMLKWAKAAMNEVTETPSEVSLKIISLGEMTELNSDYRGKDKATNVLSFPLNVKGDDGFLVMGDVAICLDVVKAEAREQNKSLSDHFAHLLVHGVLHLAGYDHENDEDAQEMEAKEVRILAAQGISAPYEIESDKGLK
ncbi:MAG: putative rRNA maturation factor [Candidatus Azotimanducaceae bacterium]|jgi:probable rRNA maturation factor